jgi:hypothetical protein
LANDPKSKTDFGAFDFEGPQSIVPVAWSVRGI